jgi:hypothetical protein
MPESFEWFQHHTTDESEAFASMCLQSYCCCLVREN